MLYTKKRLLEEVRKAKLEGIAEGKQELERQVNKTKKSGIKEGYNRGHSDRTNYYTMAVIPELEKEKEKLTDTIIRKNEDLQELERYIRELEEEQKKNKEIIPKILEESRRLYWSGVSLKKERNDLQEQVANYEVANKSLREIGERLMFRVGELKDENKELDKYNNELICYVGSLQMDLAEQEEVKMNNDLYDFQEIKRLEELMKKVKRVKVKKKIQSRIDKLMVRGL